MNVGHGGVALSTRLAAPVVAHAAAHAGAKLGAAVLPQAGRVGHAAGGAGDARLLAARARLLGWLRVGLFPRPVLEVARLQGERLPEHADAIPVLVLHEGDDSAALAVQISSAGQPREADRRVQRDSQRRPQLTHIRLGDLTAGQPVGRGVVFSFARSAHLQELLKEGVHVHAAGKGCAAARRRSEGNREK